MTIQRLVPMANQVADFFSSSGDSEAIKSTGDHLKSEAVKMTVARDAAARKSA